MDGDRKKIKKKMKTFLEAVIDIPRRTYAKGVFDEADTNNPKIKDSVKSLIDKQIEEFETEYPVVKIGLIGSILTKRYREDADLDLNVLFDVPKEKRERSVPEYITRKSHGIVQANIGKFQNSFGMGNMVIIDNSKDDKELTTQIMDRCSKAVRRLLTNKIKSYTAKRWMATERRLKRR